MKNKIKSRENNVKRKQLNNYSYSLINSTTLCGAKSMLWATRLFDFPKLVTTFTSLK